MLSQYIKFEWAGLFLFSSCCSVVSMHCFVQVLAFPAGVVNITILHMLKNEHSALSTFKTQSSRSRLALFFDMHTVHYCKMSYFPKGVFRMSGNLDQTQQDHKYATENTPGYLYRIIIRYQMNSVSSHALCGIDCDGYILVIIQFLSLF